MAKKRTAHVQDSVAAQLTETLTAKGYAVRRIKVVYGDYDAPTYAGSYAYTTADGQRTVYEFGPYRASYALRHANSLAGEAPCR